MKLKKIVPSLLLFIISGFFLFIQPSCKKIVTQTIIDTFQHAWKPVSILNMNAVSELSSVSIGDSILVVGSNSNYTMMAVNSSAINSTMVYFLQGTYMYSPAYGYPYLGKNLCSFATDSTLNVQSVPVYSQYSSFVYKPVYTPGAYSRFPQTSPYPSNTYPSSAYPVIRNKYLITPVEGYFPNIQKGERFDLISFDSSQILTPYGFGATPTVKSIYVTPAKGTLGFSGSGYFCAAFFNNFFVYYESQFFRIDTLGNVKQFGYLPAPYSNGYGIYNMFTVGNTLFAKSGGILFSSTDQGETWNVFNDFSNTTTVGWLTFRNVGNKLYATIADLNTQLFKVAFNGKNLNFSELNNDGLENSIITSITPCGKFIFITTATGVYYRDTAKFDQLKTPIR